METNEYLHYITSQGNDNELLERVVPVTLSSSTTNDGESTYYINWTFDQIKNFHDRGFSVNANWSYDESNDIKILPLVGITELNNKQSLIFELNEIDENGVLVYHKFILTEDNELTHSTGNGIISDAGDLTDGPVVNVVNNATQRLSTSQSNITINVNLSSNQVANFALGLTTSTNTTITVSKTVNGIPSIVKYSESAGNTIESGKIYQLTCVDDYWTIAEFVGEEIGANTLRFMFGKSDYDPTVAVVGSSGTWTKRTEYPGNVWDWTNENTDWREAFKGAFPDTDNEVRIIAAGDTSTVTSFANMFSGLYESDPHSSGYKLLLRNNVVSCVPIDVSGAVNGIYRMFIASSLREYVPLNLNDLGTTTSLYGVFADTLIEEVDEVDFGHIAFTANAMSAYFAQCAKLRRVGDIKNCENLHRVDAMFTYCVNLESIGTIGYLGAAQTMRKMFQVCEKLTSDITINAPQATDCSGMFNACYMVEKINITVGSPLKCQYMFGSCINLREITGLDSIHAVGNISHLFYHCHKLPHFPALNYEAIKNCNSFACECFDMHGHDTLVAYEGLSAHEESITDHADCFMDCGINTEEGRAALAQIPTSWGGTKEEV